MAAARYALTQEADEDLLRIAQYTIETWGFEQALRYEAALEASFTAIAEGKARSKVFIKTRPELRVIRCEHHYIFHLEREIEPPLILSVLHENMDLITRIKKRLPR